MSRQRLVVFGLVGAAGLAGAYALGMFDDAPAQDAVATRPASAEAPAPVTTLAPPRAAPARPELPSAGRPVSPKVTVPPLDPEPPAPTTASLRIDSDVPGAQVFLDNKFVGAAPVTAQNVQPGQRKVNVQAPGHEGVVEFVDVTPGSHDVMISLKTIRLDQRVSVEHRHRMGSCVGTLLATPEGVRYQTSHKEDAFSVSLQNIETFTADFLQKNLKLKIKGGKTYDFTDPSGKAEAIYLFHQEVDKVRQRVK